MNKNKFFKEYGKVMVKFYMFDNHSAYYRASFIDNTELIMVLSGDQVASSSFDTRKDIKVSDPSPHNVIFLLTLPGEKTQVIE